mgnify:CR=1 FL=1
MATTMEIVRGISQVMANSHDGALDADGAPIKVGLKREEGDPIVDSRVMDGFKCSFHGPQLCVHYHAEIKLKDVHDKNFESDLERMIGKIATFIKKEYKKTTGDTLTLKKVGLGYIKIGQQATTLSGGEAQRIKLAKELSKRSTGRTMYILDEPTTGLHQHDIKKLLEILHTFVATGNTVVVIEHNLDVIKTADHIIDMGPEGGINGGEIIAQGKPEDICKIDKSYTGKFLKNFLNSKYKKTA